MGYPGGQRGWSVSAAAVLVWAAAAKHVTLSGAGLVRLIISSAAIGIPAAAAHHQQWQHRLPKLQGVHKK